MCCLYMPDQWAMPCWQCVWQPVNQKRAIETPLQAAAAAGGGGAQRRWDLRVPGVTTLSVDVHKYGHASKGVSVCVFREVH